VWPPLRAAETRHELFTARPLRRCATPVPSGRHRHWYGVVEVRPGEGVRGVCLIGAASGHWDRSADRARRGPATLVTRLDEARAAPPPVRFALVWEDGDQMAWRPCDWLSSTATRRRSPVRSTCWLWPVRTPFMNPSYATLPTERSIHYVHWQARTSDGERLPLAHSVCAECFLTRSDTRRCLAATGECCGVGSALVRPFHDQHPVGVPRTSSTPLCRAPLPRHQWLASPPASSACGDQCAGSFSALPAHSLGRIATDLQVLASRRR
jgi:hypothetical protein